MKFEKNRIKSFDSNTVDSCLDEKFLLNMFAEPFAQILAG